MATEYYVTLAQLKLAITMKGVVVDRDDLLTFALNAAHEDVAEHCGRRFDLAATATPRLFDVAGRLVVDGSVQQLIVDDIGSLTGFAVATGSGGSFTALSATPRYVPANALVQNKPITALELASAAWPTDGLTQVQVTAKWGWPVVPSRVRQATLLQAIRLYRRKDSPEGVIGSAEWGALRVSKVDPDVEALLSRLVLPGF